MKTLAALAASLVLLVGCAATPEQAPESTGSDGGKLELQVRDGRVTGTFTLASDKLTFESSIVKDGVHEIDIKVHGLVLDATVDASGHVASIDGFAEANGEDTQLLENDRTFVLAFYKALEADKELPKEADMLRRVTSIWSETSPTLKLDRRVMGEQGRGWTSLCQYIGGVYDSSHDCWSGDWWASKTSVHSYIGYATGSTYYWRGYWSTSSYDHAGWPYEYGDCYARCGADCGSQVYTVDCNNHDNCVRNGHSIASAWCDDQFSAASDDYMFADNCGRD